MKKSFLFPVLLLQSGILAGEIVLPELEAPGLIDGNLAEAVWQKAWKTGPFHNLDGGALKEKTEGFLFVDKENLYIGIQCHFRDHEAKTKEIAAVGAPFAIDVAEIFLDPGCTGNYQHIAVNAAGILHFPGRLSDIRYGVQVYRTFWSLEAKIPFRALRIQGERFSPEWGINLARGNPAAKENATWAPLRNGTFHEPDAFLRVSGIPVDLAALAGEQAERKAGSFALSLDRILYDGQENLQAVLELKYTKSMKGFHLRADILSREGRSLLSRTIRPVFFTNEFTLPLSGLRNGRYKLHLQLFNGAGKALKSAEKSFWKIPLKTSKPKNILTIRDHNFYLNGKFFFPIFSIAYPGSSEKESMTREQYLAYIADYYSGDYRDASYNCVEAGSLDISTETDFEALKKIGGLEAWNFGEWTRRQKLGITTRDMINARVKGGVYSIPTPYYLKCHTEITDEMIDRWVAMMLKLRDLDNILMWSMADETDAEIEGNRLRYQLYKEMDPDRPAWLNVINAVTQNQEFADVLSTDPYPIPNGKVTMVSAHADRLVRACREDPGKTCMLWLQIFGEGPGQAWPRPPTPQEMEVMAFLAMNHGIRGIGWWTFQPKEDRVLPRQHPDTFERQKIVHARIRELAPAYCLGEKTMMKLQGRIDVAVLKYQGKTMISCANTVNEPVQAELSIPDRVTCSARLKYAGCEVRIENGIIRDSFQPYEVRIYEY